VLTATATSDLPPALLYLNCMGNPLLEPIATYVHTHLHPPPQQSICVYSIGGVVALVVLEHWWCCSIGGGVALVVLERVGCVVTRAPQVHALVRGG